MSVFEMSSEIRLIAIIYKNIIEFYLNECESYKIFYKTSLEFEIAENVSSYEQTPPTAAEFLQ